MGRQYHALVRHCKARDQAFLLEGDLFAELGLFSPGQRVTKQKSGGQETPPRRRGRDFYRRQTEGWGAGFEIAAGKTDGDSLAKLIS